MNHLLINILLIILFVLVGNIIFSISSNYKKDKLLENQKKLEDKLKSELKNYGLSLQLAKKVGLLLSAIPLDKILASVSNDMKDDIELHLEELLNLLNQFENK